MNTYTWLVQPASTDLETLPKPNAWKRFVCEGMTDAIREWLFASMPTEQRELWVARDDWDKAKNGNPTLMHRISLRYTKRGQSAPTKTGD